jgi:hypothetical protein
MINRQTRLRFLNIVFAFAIIFISYLQYLFIVENVQE